MSLGQKSIIRRQVKMACDGLERMVLDLPEEDLYHALKGGQSAAWHLMHCATWICIVGEVYKARFEPCVYAKSSKQEVAISNIEILQQITASKNRALQHFDKLTEVDLFEEIRLPFPIKKSGNIAPISRLKLWSWLPRFIEFQRGFLLGQLQIDPHNRRIEEFL